MSHYDVFNGDADGICALQQLRLAQPLEGVLVTGMKRDIALLQRVPALRGDTVTVLDVSLHRNREALEALLARGVAVEYFDHHFAGDVPLHPLLRAILDPSPGVCTSVLVDRHLQGQHRLWAATGAFGDNLPDVGEALARSAGLAAPQVEALRRLGEAINYNAYGESVEDLLLHPAQLAAKIRPYANPLDFAAQDPVAAALAEQQAADLAQAMALAPSRVLPGATVYVLPDVPWGRRVQGAFANAASLRDPARAHAILRESGAEAYNASVRAPQQHLLGADALCLSFPTGGGRAGAAGIDRLPRHQLDSFIAALDRAFPAPS